MSKNKGELSLLTLLKKNLYPTASQKKIIYKKAKQNQKFQSCHFFFMHFLRVQIHTEVYKYQLVSRHDKCMTY